MKSSKNLDVWYLLTSKRQKTFWSLIMLLFSIHFGLIPFRWYCGWMHLIAPAHPSVLLQLWVFWAKREFAFASTKYCCRSSWFVFDLGYCKELDSTRLPCSSIGQEGHFLFGWFKKKINRDYRLTGRRGMDRLLLIFGHIWKYQKYQNFSPNSCQPTKAVEGISLETLSICFLKKSVPFANFLF